MTFTIKSTDVNNYHVYMEQDKYSTAYKVGVVPRITESLCGFPIDERYYDTKDKANRRYRDLVRKAKEEIL